jgi:hypothetical protein
MSEVRENALRVWVAPEEKEQIQINAENCSLSCSAYLRQLGLGYIPASKLDAAAMRQLAKVNGDMGRLGGLLKMMLTNQERCTPETEKALERLLGEIEEAQRELLAAAKQLKPK